jgi:hypothetical protein
MKHRDQRLTQTRGDFVPAGQRPPAECPPLPGGPVYGTMVPGAGGEALQRMLHPRGHSSDGTVTCALWS